MGRKTDVKHLDTYKRMSHGRQPNKKKKVFVLFFFPDGRQKRKKRLLYGTVFINAGAFSNAFHGEVLNKNERLTQHHVYMIKNV